MNPNQISVYVSGPDGPTRIGYGTLAELAAGTLHADPAGLALYVAATAVAEEEATAADVDAG